MVLLLLHGILALDNGLGLTPPLGWRSYNAFGGNVHQPMMEAMMVAMMEARMVAMRVAVMVEQSVLVGQFLGYPFLNSTL